MGCWNGTCMISNLPIMSGEKIKLIILQTFISKKEISSSSFCYPTDLMFPTFLAISGKYNDYGNIKDIKKDWNYEIIEKVLKERYSEIKADDEVKTDFGLEDILHGIERGTWKGFSAKKTGKEEFETTDLCFVMIREDVWNGICSEYKGEFWNDNQEETDRGEYYITAKEWCKRKFNTALEHISEFNDAVNETNEDVKRERLLKNMIHFSESNIFNGSREDGRLALGGNLYHDYLIDEKSDKDSVFKAWSEHIIINSLIHSTRKSWMITSGGGSQSAEWKEYLVLNNIVNKICDKMIEEYGDEEE